MTSTYTQTHSNLNYRCKLGEGGVAEGGWRQLKWKSRTDQYSWRFSSIYSPLNCHALSKQLEGLCLPCSHFLLSFFLCFLSFPFLLSFFLCFFLFLFTIFSTTFHHHSRLCFFVFFLEMLKFLLNIFYLKIIRHISEPTNNILACCATASHMLCSQKL